MKKWLFLLSFFLSLSAYCQIITTIAGNDTGAYRGDGGPASLAEFNSPVCIACDNAGNIFIADPGNSRVRKINSSGIVSTIAGNGIASNNDDSIATGAELNLPFGVAVDGIGNVFIADCSNSRVCKVNSAGIFSVVVGTGYYGNGGDGGPATLAQLWNPSGVAIDGSGNLYISDGFNHRIRKVDTSGIISTIAGSYIAGYTGDGGPATDALLNTPNSVIADKKGNVYFSDYNSIRKIDTSGIISTIAGFDTSSGYSGDNGPATTALFHTPVNMALDGFGNLYVADVFNNRIRKISPAGIITTVAGNGTRGFGGDSGLAINAMLNYPNGVGVDHFGNIYIADSRNERIRYIASSVFVATENSVGFAINTYPNPSSGRFIVSVTSDSYMPAALTITNMLGVRIKELMIPTNTPSEILLDAPPGIYFINLQLDNSILQKEIVIK
jgi:sugar lactone lactonase YvrE